MSQLAETWQKLDLRRRIVLLGAIGITFLAVFSLAQIASRPGMALLYSGLDPAAAGEVIGALEQMNVPSEIRGDAIYVAEGERDRVRLALAGENLPRQGPNGYELLDQLSGFSSTSDMFNAAYWRAKEGELARTILASSGVVAARVHIAVPTTRPFAPSDADATASVTVTMASGALGQDQAQAIRFITALAVPNLSPSQVGVIDSRVGVVLAPGEENGSRSASAQAAEREAQIKYDIEQMLAPLVGRDRARVTVRVETELESETLIERKIDPESRVVISSNTEEISDNSEGSAGNVTVASNLPDGDANAQNNRTAARTESREQNNFGYSEIERETVRQPGAIRRVSVAVLVDGVIAKDPSGQSIWQARPQEELDTIRELVTAAIGFDEERGDIVTVDSMAFQPDATPGALVEVGPVVRFLERNAMTLIQLGFLGVVILVLGMTVIKPLLSKRDIDMDPADQFPGVGMVPSGSELSEDAIASLPVADDHTLDDDAMATELALDPSLPAGEALKNVIADKQEKAVEMLATWLDEEQNSAEAKELQREPA